MTIQNTFTQDQIKFLSERLFDVMAEDFDYSLKPSKRKALLAKVMSSPNYDALLQRSASSEQSSPDQEVIEIYYRWLKPSIEDGVQHYGVTGDPRYDEFMLSDLHFDSPNHANNLNDLAEWGYGQDDLEGLVLFKMTQTKAEQDLAVPTSNLSVHEGAHMDTNLADEA